MRRAGVLVVVSIAAILTAIAWSVGQAPKLPAEVQYVCVTDEDGTPISIVQPYPWRTELVDLETSKANIRSAVNLAGRSTNRSDVIEASYDVQLVDNPIPPLDRKPRPRRNPNAGQNCYTVCGCAKPIYCDEALPEPGTEAIRKAPSPPGGGVCGCGPGCGTCELCRVVCR